MKRLSVLGLLAILSGCSDKGSYTNAHQHAEVGTWYGVAYNPRKHWAQGFLYVINIDAEYQIKRFK